MNRLCYWLVMRLSERQLDYFPAIGRFITDRAAIELHRRVFGDIEVMQKQKRENP